MNSHHFNIPPMIYWREKADKTISNWMKFKSLIGKYIPILFMF